MLRELYVIRTTEVTPGMLRITLTGDQLHSFEVGGHPVAPFVSSGFDDHVKLLVPLADQDRPPLPIQGPDRLEWGAAGGRPVAKEYTPRRFDRDTGELDLDFVRHGSGFAAGWAEQVQPGSPAWIVGPTRSLRLPQGHDWMLVAGDETAMPAIGRLLEHWPPSWRAQVVIELSHDSHRQDLTVPEGVELTWVVGTHAWHQALRDLHWWPGDPFCWVAGETRAVREVRTFLADERTVARDLLDVNGYWRR